MRSTENIFVGYGSKYGELLGVSPSLLESGLRRVANSVVHFHAPFRARRQGSHQVWLSSKVNLWEGSYRAYFLPSKHAYLQSRGLPTIANRYMEAWHLVGEISEADVRNRNPCSLVEMGHVAIFSQTIFRGVRSVRRGSRVPGGLFDQFVGLPSS